MYVQNRVALITGGVSGLGLCIAKEFLKNGVRVCQNKLLTFHNGVALMDINEEISQEVVTLLKKEYGEEKTTFIKGDVTNASEFEDAFEKTIEVFKNIDIVVNAAGVADEVNSKKTIDINLGGVLTGTFLAMDNYLPKYKTMSDPVIVNISSIFGLDGVQFSIVYTATKHAVIEISSIIIVIFNLFMLSKGVTLMDINEEIGQEIEASLKKEYGPEKTIFVKGDVTNALQFEDAFKKTIEVFNNIDIVVNNAGISDEVNSKKTIDINLGGVLTGTYLAMDNYLPKYKTMPDPIIVNISSIFGLDGIQTSVAYTGTKHAVIGIGKCLSMKEHFQATGVKIITLCPGVTETPLLSSYRLLPGRYEEIAKNMVPDLYMQKPEMVSRSLVKILDVCNTGDVWVVEDDKCKQLEIPNRFSLEVLKTLDV
ncbi:15-hydroxyprostaglandin dehydrogenase [nad(+)] [Holotrichia oblita]|uniref:15-hydroxyprostaglandin dehydrogenase [nad(+)] n=1 Tax=Holotrichia oblita TaxID=644536 RepID=A0ACB9TXA6_HOLOL|nr:15-hydroxyprostaglandin dehydrogenase [nad(+)] [Holotrichia oblita]